MSQPKTGASRGRVLSGLLEDRRRLMNLMTVAFGVVVAVLLAVWVPNFFTVGNIINVLEQLTTMGTLCLGMTCVLIVGGIDLSMSSILIAAVSTGALFMSRGGNFAVGILVILATGLLFGLINGVAVSKAHMIPFIVTLSTQIVASGFAIFITGSKSIFGFPDGFLALGASIGVLPVSIPVFFVLALLVHLFLSRTKYGRIFYMVGQNTDAARVVGIRTGRYLLLAYLISGFFAAAAGILLAARTNMAGSTMVGDTMIMDTVSAAVIGGASLSGGKGVIYGSVVGALFITLISNSINLMGITYYTGLMIKGAVIIAIIALDRLRTNI